MRRQFAGRQERVVLVDRVMNPLAHLLGNSAATELELTEEDLAQLGRVSELPPSYPQWIQDMFHALRAPA